MRFIGLDLAWGQRARTGVAEVDSAGRLIRSGSVITDDEITAFIQGAGEAEMVVAIDAPLIVPNATGQRPCETQVARLFGRYGAYAHSANRSNPIFLPRPRALSLALAHGWEVDPAVTPGKGRSVAIEVYPHPAMVSLFRLDRIIPYKAKTGRTVPMRIEAFHRLLENMVESLPVLRLAEFPRWHELCDELANASRQVDLNRIEDEVDAMLCAHLAWLWATEPRSLVVIGDATAGYIITPHPPGA